jgi:cytochrome c-type biogenesis protein CcmH
MRPPTRLVVVAGIALAVALGVGYVLFATHGRAGDAASGTIEERSLAVERQLLCPQCTDERLDVCNLAICNDMKAVIKQRLQNGDAPQTIIEYFQNRYGQRVLAQVPARGFNLVLFGWVGGSLALVALAGGAFLVQLRRGHPRAAPAAATAAAGATAPDDAWLDRQLEAGEDDR